MRPSFLWGKKKKQCHIFKAGLCPRLDGLHSVCNMRNTLSAPVLLMT